MLWLLFLVYLFGNADWTVEIFGMDKSLAAEYLLKEGTFCYENYLF
jgi:hypothetical protein